VIHEILAAALKRATEALGRDDASAATAALQEAALACEGALLQGLRLEPAQIRAIRPIHAQCGKAIDATRQRLAVARGALAQARRAGDAYHR
jgi:bacterioferritin-associated ferredoxin